MTTPVSLQADAVARLMMADFGVLSDKNGPAKNGAGSIRLPQACRGELVDDPRTPNTVLASRRQAFAAACVSQRRQRRPAKIATPSKKMPTMVLAAASVAIRPGLPQRL